MAKIKSTFSLNFEDQTQLYYDLLNDEDFDFKTKNIQIKITQNNSSLIITIHCDTILDLKIANSAILRSLEIINKTLQI